MKLPDAIRILIVHDDPIVEAGLACALARHADFDVRGRQGEQRVAGSALRQVDVVVADYEQGVCIAGEARRSLSEGQGPRIVIVGGVDREWEIKSALERGIRGYMLVGCSADELAIAVRSVHRGMRHLSPKVAHRLAESFSLEPLTLREEEVLSLVVKGLCNKAISRQLGIAVGTVKSHLKASFEKLNVESRTQAVAVLERRGLLRTGRPAMSDPGAVREERNWQDKRPAASVPEASFAVRRSLQPAVM